MSFDEDRKRKELPASSSAEALAHQNLRIQVEKQIAQAQTAKRQLEELKTQVERDALKQETAKQQSDHGTKGSVQQTEKLQKSAEATRKDTPSTIIEKGKQEKAIVEKLAKEERAKPGP
jgi:hypothetical protein